MLTDGAAVLALLLLPCRGVQAAPKLLIPEETASADPDNVPPRSRLFLVVPKTAEARIVHVSIRSSWQHVEVLLAARHCCKVGVLLAAVEVLLAAVDCAGVSAHRCA